jgi:hypothetical protein
MKRLNRKLIVMAVRSRRFTRILARSAQAFSWDWPLLLLWPVLKSRLAAGAGAVRPARSQAKTARNRGKTGI